MSRRWCLAPLCIVLGTLPARAQEEDRASADDRVTLIDDVRDWRGRLGTRVEESDIGAGLMRRAVSSPDGPLTDAHAPLAEQESLAHLFAGAIGSYTNPHSHRNVTLEPDESVELLILASHLLGIVDSRQSDAKAK